MEINSLTIKKIPTSVNGAAVFAKLDIRSENHQIGMKTSNVYETPFTTYFRHYEYLCKPFGLIDALTIIQALILLVFFDDILVIINLWPFWFAGC
jgi:hypothetical protein